MRVAQKWLEITPQERRANCPRHYSMTTSNAILLFNRQDDCKVFSNPFMASLSNHRQLEQASFDKLRMSRH